MQRNSDRTNKVSDEEMLEEARRLGLNYQETIAWPVKTTGGQGTHVYSNTNIEEVKKHLKD